MEPLPKNLQVDIINPYIQGDSSKKDKYEEVLRGLGEKNILGGVGRPF